MMDFEKAMMEIAETETAVAEVKVTEKLRAELSRIRDDLGISPHVNITDDMIRWILVAAERSK